MINEDVQRPAKKKFLVSYKENFSITHSAD